MLIGIPDPQKSQNSAGLEAQNGTMKVVERSKWRRGGSKLSRRGSVNLDEEQDPDPHYSEKSYLDPHFKWKEESGTALK